MFSECMSCSRCCDRASSVSTTSATARCSFCLAVIRLILLWLTHYGLQGSQVLGLRRRRVLLRDGGRWWRWRPARCEEVGDLGGESGQGVRFPAAGAVFFDDGAQVGVAVESGSPESGASGDIIEGDGVPGENDCCAGVFDVLAALFGVIRSVPD